ncbi:mechanosensitive ion channel family protein [Marinoscillum sp.]|uniref:mechanosensitive ion channel family protein n=1 Tax=Marinoscillum sp. TaxID=2024838 RepID=UPI003BA9BC7B
MIRKFATSALLLLISMAALAQDKAVDDLKKQAPKLSEIFSIPKLFWSLVLVVAGWILIKLFSRILEVLAERSTRYRITLKGLIPVVRIIGWILVIITIITGIFQPPMATVLALSASVGVAVGFAAQDILKNIFGGVMILFDRPFQVGDKIEVGSFYGEVTQIGLRSTRIVTPDDSLVAIPNSTIMNGSVSNANSGEANCQVVAEIWLPLSVDTVRVREIAMQAAQVSKYVYLNKPIAVLFFNEVKERRSYLKMRLKAYVMDIRSEFVFKSEMTELVISSLLEEGIIKEEDFR